MTRGIDVRQSTGRIVFRASLKSSVGAKITSGTTELRLYRVENDGTLDVYDWTTNNFVAIGSGTPDDETTMTHQLRRDSSGADVATGIWTVVLSSLTNFTIGNVYIAQVTNSGASPESQEREFQFGDVEGDTADIVAAQALAALNASEVVDNTIDTLAQVNATDAVVDSTATAVGTLTTNLAQKPTLAQILAGGDVDGRTLEETLKLLAAALVGKVTVATVGSVTTVTFRAVDDSKARITATTDVSGNRTAVTLDVTG